MYNPAEELSSISFDKIIGGALNAVVSAQNTSSLTSVNFIKSVGFENDENGNAIKPVYVDFKYPKEVQPYQAAVPASAYLSVVKRGSGYSADRVDSVEVDFNGTKCNVRLSVDSEGAVRGAELLNEASVSKLIEKSDFQEVSATISHTEEEKGADENAQEAEIKLCKREEEKEKPAVYQDMVLQVPILTIVPIPFIRVSSTDIELNVKINSIYTSDKESSTNSSAGTSGSAKFGGLFASGSISMNASISHQKKNSEKEEVKKEYSLNIKIHAVQDDVPVGMSRVLDILEESIVPKKSNEAA